MATVEPGIARHYDISDLEQRILAALEPVATATAARALVTPLDEVGGAAFRADLASMRHETQYTRLFRS